MNKVIAVGLERTISVVNKLTELGILVLECRYDGISKPTITVEHHLYCDQLINEGRAIHYTSGSADNGLYLRGQFLMNHCYVIWQERNANTIARNKLRDAHIR